MTQEQEEYIKYAKHLIPNLESRLSSERDCIAELRVENDHKFAAMCRLREEIADIKKLFADKQTLVMELAFENRALRNALRETLTVLDYSDTTYPQQEEWWSYDKSIELKRLLE